ncbi:MAG TPA: sugar ABC transporter permease [Symbiobacteriaceae bacterium]|nr:sugar ABC transporter permease [Symbiobacteriaceae bacterium]
MKLGATLGKWLDLPVGTTKYTRRKFWADTALAYLFLLPALLVIGTFVFYPVIYAFFLSLTSADPMTIRTGTIESVGLANYKEIFQDPVFWKAVKNTIIFVVGTVPVQIILSLFIALGLNKGLRFRSFYRLAFFVPYVTTTVAISMVWAWIFHDQWGLLNYILSWFGAKPQLWLSDPKWTMFTIIIMSIWKTLGYTAVLFLAGLQNVDRELYNAAKVDGANSTQMFWNVTWPMLTPTTFFVSITALIGAFKVFTEIFVLYGGRPGPAYAGVTMVFYVYERAFTDYRFGYASAAAYVLFFMVMAVTLFQLWYAKKRVHYD